MADKFAPEAPVKDARVQTFAYKATEIKAVDSTVKETATEYDSARVVTALKSGSKVTKVKDEEILKKPTEKELHQELLKMMQLKQMIKELLLQF